LYKILQTVAKLGGQVWAYSPERRP